MNTRVESCYNELLKQGNFTNPDPLYSIVFQPLYNEIPNKVISNTLEAFGSHLNNDTKSL